MTTEDDFVEKLLKKLPKAPPMSDLEVKRFEKHVDALVAAENKKKVSKGWNSKFSVAASVIALVAGVAIFVDSSEIINPKNSQNPGITSPSSSPTSGIGQGGSSSQNPTVPLPEGSGSTAAPEPGKTTYGNSQSPKPGQSKGSIPVLNYGFDYQVDEQSARTKVKSDARLGDTKLMKSSQIACSVKLGVDQDLYAIDKGTYAGENVEVYYFGSSKNALNIKIVGFGCELLREL
jgi:hypothetical protein